MTSSYSKTSFFVHPHVSEIPALSKISTLKIYLFGDGFNRIRVDRRRNWRKNNSVFKSTPISVDEVIITYANYLHLITGESRN